MHVIYSTLIIVISSQQALIGEALFLCLTLKSSYNALDKVDAEIILYCMQGVFQRCRTFYHFFFLSFFLKLIH